MKSWRKAGLILDQEITEIEIMLKDLEDRAVKVAHGKGLGSGGSEQGSDLSGLGV